MSVEQGNTGGAVRQAAEFYTVAQLARRWRVNPAWLRRRCRRGLLVKPVRLGAAIRFALADVERFEAGGGTPRRG